MEQQENIGTCGLDCAACPAFRAQRDNDDNLRKETAVQWQLTYDYPFRAEDINCTGCRQEGVKIGHCGQCQMRKCAIEHDAQNCGQCAHYPCPTISDFLKSLPEAAAQANCQRLAQNS